jgi:hypothetical protein
MYITIIYYDNKRPRVRMTSSSLTRTAAAQGCAYESGTRRRVSSLREEAGSLVLPYSEGQ